MRYLIGLLLLMSCENPEQREMFINRVKNMQASQNLCMEDVAVIEYYLDDWGNEKINCY